MNRRDLFQLPAAAMAAVPAPASQTQRQGDAATEERSVFDAHQAETVAILVGLIIPATDTPGAREAGVDRYIDLLLRDGDAAVRRQFLEGVAWMDGHAMRLHGKAFARLTEAQQTEILRVLDAGTLEEAAAGARFFRQLKSLTSRIYYATEAGFRELNKGGRAPSTYGCHHAEHG